ncbi:PREDICTED: uncharacterized protein LOC108361853, partial [Rhagoletis zephyria]|uniref:uncharacterized protein LOC108361853 n=1 Tax=Rhagoletis zephyria TaxID=28612 RepID=UPI0008119DC6
MILHPLGKLSNMRGIISNRSSTNLIQIKKLNAQFRRKIKDAKLVCFQKFTSNITASSDPKKIWADIKKLTGLPSNSHIKFLNSTHGNLVYPREIAQELASHFSNASSDQHDNMEDKIFRLYPKLTLSSNPLIRNDFQAAAARIHTCALFAKYVDLPFKQHPPRYTHRQGTDFMEIAFFSAKEI